MYSYLFLCSPCQFQRVPNVSFPSSAFGDFNHSAFINEDEFEARRWLGDLLLVDERGWSNEEVEWVSPGVHGHLDMLKSDVA
jgi:hypothetical protein